MDPANITRDEALHRSSVLAVHSYDVTVDLTGRDVDGSPLAQPGETFVSTTTIAFQSAAEQSWVDLIADSVLSATLDGQEIDPASHQACRLPLNLESGLHTLTVTALCRYSRTGEGLHRFVDPADGRVYLYSQFETADARRMYANFEQPDLKATFKLSVVAPAGWQVISNSAAVDPVDLGDATQRWHFEPTKPLSTYLTALVAGEYHVEPGEITSIDGPVPARLVCRQSMVPYLDSERIRTTTQRGFDVFEKAFGLSYQFGTYDQVFVPQFNAGAMENAGCVTIRDEYLFRSRVTSASFEGRDNTILHELAHMWFGDLVTMRWWDDLWLNESFAEWAAYYAQSSIAAQFGGSDPWVSFANSRKTWAYREDQLPTTHPVAADMVDLEAVEDNFDGITYAKGASVLKQLVSFVGEDAFLEGVRAYFAQHAYANTEFSDLLHALQVASSRDLSGFSGDWLETAGVNTLTPEFGVDEQGNIDWFDVVQTATAEHPALRTQRIAVGLYDLTLESLECRESLEVDVHGDRTPISALIGRRPADLMLLNDRDLSYCKVRLDAKSLRTALAHLPELSDPLARSVLHTSLWDMWRDAELPSRRYLDAVLDALASETDLTAVRSQLANVQLAATGYSAPPDREANRAHLVAGLGRLLKGAQPGSDLQLALADALIAAVSSQAGAKLVQGWLDGEEVPDGLVIDTDRRWSILTSLSRLGWLDDQLIAAELERDNTIAGAEAAAGVRAAGATAAAKAETWRLVSEDPSVPNGTYSAICRNFWAYGQEELTAPYVARYLSMCEQISAKQGVWAGRGHAVIDTALNWLWPAPHADQAFIDRVDEWTASAKLSETVRRATSENRDRALRALAAQAADAGLA